MLHELLGTSAPLSAVREQLARLTTREAAPRRLPAVLIQGETGTGKGLLTAWIPSCGVPASSTPCAST